MGQVLLMFPPRPDQREAFRLLGSLTFFYAVAAIESFSKLGDSIYFEEEGGAAPTLYVIQFISSTLNWRSGQITLQQNTQEVSSLDSHFRVQFTVASVNKVIQQHEFKSPSTSSTLSIRVPIWTSKSGAVATINGQSVAVPSPGETAVMTSDSQVELVQPFPLMMVGNVLSITKAWSSNDLVNLSMPIGLRTEAIQDDRPEFSSLRAVLFGPYLLVGLSSGESDMGKQDVLEGLSDWILPVPDDHRLQLVSLTQESCGGTKFLSGLNASGIGATRLLTMAASPKLGTNAAAQATFRLVYADQKAAPQVASREDVIGRVVLLEPFDLPDKVVRHQGAGKGLVISVTGDVPQNGTDSVFRVVKGLDGNSTTISLEADSTPGCFVHHDCVSGDGVGLVCPANDADRNSTAFRTAASFTFGKGLSGYHPISFTAKGTKRSFLLQPLLSLRDETYTTYFNIGV
ncbi:hypothetical protein BHM03_00035639 [Ensete ventricosum]|nr:hypothetical protein BHM03_00035639 [Ensete ventricosum]